MRFVAGVFYMANVAQYIFYDVSLEGNRFNVVQDGLSDIQPRLL